MKDTRSALFHKNCTYSVEYKTRLFKIDLRLAAMLNASALPKAIIRHDNKIIFYRKINVFIDL